MRCALEWMSRERKKNFYPLQCEFWETMGECWKWNNHIEHAHIFRRRKFIVKSIFFVESVDSQVKCISSKHVVCIFFVFQDILFVHLSSSSTSKALEKFPSSSIYISFTMYKSNSHIESSSRLNEFSLFFVHFFFRRAMKLPSIHFFPPKKNEMKEKRVYSKLYYVTEMKIHSLGTRAPWSTHLTWNIIEVMM